MIYEVENLAFAYSASSPRVLDGINLTVQEGDIIALLGRNGCGKSTLLNCMLGLLTPQQGGIRLTGKPLKSMREKEIAAAAGYVPQNNQSTFAYSVLQFVVMGCASRIGMFSHPEKQDYIAAEKALEELGIAHLAHRPYTELSGGERQQAAIARAIVSDPQVILFDEPTAHLDVANQLRVLRIVRQLSQKGYAVVITTHNPDHALLLGGKAALMNGKGQLSVGAVEQVLTPQALTDVYGETVYLEWIESAGRMACLSRNL